MFIPVILMLFCVVESSSDDNMGFDLFGGGGEELENQSLDFSKVHN